MPNFVCLCQCVQHKMQVSQNFRDKPRKCLFLRFKLEILYDLLLFEACAYYSEILTPKLQVLSF